jgi:hypothetical protein
MNRPTFADPRTDFTFNRIFGSEQRNDVLVAFLNDMLDLDAAIPDARDATRSAPPALLLGSRSPSDRSTTEVGRTPGGL